MKNIKIAGLICAVLFALLLTVRLDVHRRLFPVSVLKPVASAGALPNRDTWMNVFQNSRKIGYSHTVFTGTEEGYLYAEALFLRINTLGFSQDLKLNTRGGLQPDLTLSWFEFDMSSGRFQFSAKGTVTGKAITIQTETAGTRGRVDIPIEEAPILTGGIAMELAARNPEPGEEFAFSVFDPAGMMTESVRVKVLNREPVRVSGIDTEATKMATTFKSITQFSWIGKNGELLKEEGMLGLSLEKTDRADALHGMPIQESQDLTKVASVASNVRFEDPYKLTALRVNLLGIDLGQLPVDGGRQAMAGRLLSIEKETLSDLPDSDRFGQLRAKEKDFLLPTLFIQSDHPSIVKLAQRITEENDTPLVKAEKIVGWIEKNIQKRPVLSVPDAVSTLENRVGDCNEHAVLTAALARAAGIPAEVEAGLVYMKGRFYYHAWNRLFLGRWVTVDSVFGQVPADVTHIRLGAGERKMQLDLMHVIDRVALDIVDYK